ncbi:hypothetical protein BDV12DRAFT_160508 [Aspergillus spectabilis]
MPSWLYSSLFIPCHCLKGDNQRSTEILQPRRSEPSPTAPGETKWQTTHSALPKAGCGTPPRFVLLKSWMDINNQWDVQIESGELHQSG